MNQTAAITLYGYGTSEGVRKEWDARGRGRKPSTESEGFFSPSTQEGMTFEQAVQKLNSPEQQHAIQEATNIENQVFGQGSTNDSAVGEWKDGAENSVLMHVPPTASKDDLEYALATLGKDFNQKSVLAFSHDPMGKDAVWTLHTPQSMDMVRKALDAEGMEFRTLVPEQGGTAIHVYDQGMGMSKNISRLATTLRGRIEVASGQGEFIGGDTREQGQSQYDKIISTYQGTHGLGTTGVRRDQQLGGNGLSRRSQATA